MLANPRNLALFLALAGGALATWFLARDTSLPAATPAVLDEVRQGYYLEKAVIRKTDASGQFSERIHSERVEQSADGERLVFDGIRVEYSRRDSSTWIVAAQSATAPADRSAFDFAGDVRVSQATSAAAEEFVLETEALHLDTDGLRVSTDRQISVQDLLSGSTTTATGLELDLNSGSMNLGSGVVIRGMRAPAAVAVSILASGAYAQEPAENTYEINCASLQGFETDESAETICAGAEIRVGDDVISAGSASAQRITELDGAWAFRDDVTFRFGTARIQAASARFEFDSGELIYAELLGSPVVMTDIIEATETPVRGESDSIAYDEVKGTLRLTGEATFVRGANRAVGCDWIYNFKDKSFSAGTTECRIQATVAAPEETDTTESQSRTP